MSLNKALVLSGVLLLGNANASDTFNPDLSTKTNYQIVNVKVGVESIFSELQKIKKICNINGKNESSTGFKREYIEKFGCQYDNNRDLKKGEIKTTLYKIGKIKNFTCYNLEAILKLISNGKTVTTIRGDGAILEDENGSLLMSESCDELTLNNK